MDTSISPSLDLRPRDLSQSISVEEHRKIGLGFVDKILRVMGPQYARWLHECVELSANGSVEYTKIVLDMYQASMTMECNILLRNYILKGAMPGFQLPQQVQAPVWALSDDDIETLVTVTKHLMLDLECSHYIYLEGRVINYLQENEESGFNGCFGLSYQTKVFKMEIFKICREVKIQFRRHIRLFTFGRTKVTINEFYTKIVERYLSPGSSALENTHRTHLLILRRLARENPEVIGCIEPQAVSSERQDDADNDDDDDYFCGDDDDISMGASESMNWWFCVENWFRERISDWGSIFDSLEWRHYIQDCQMIEERHANIVNGLPCDHGLAEASVDSRYQYLSKFDHDERPRRRSWGENSEVLYIDSSAGHCADIATDDGNWSARRPNLQLMRWISEQQQLLDNSSEDSRYEIMQNDPYPEESFMASANHLTPSPSKYST